MYRNGRAARKRRSRAVSESSTRRAGFQDRKQRVASRRMDGIRRDLADRILARRLALGLTQEAAANAANMDIRQWQHLEAASAKNPTLLSLADVADALDLTLSQLLKPPTRRKKKS